MNFKNHVITKNNFLFINLILIKNVNFIVTSVGNSFILIRLNIVLLSNA